MKRVKHNNGDRIGRFKISRSQLYTNEWEDILEFLRDFVVIRCEYRPVEEAYIYTAMSEHFEEVDPGEKIPWYEVQMLFREDTGGASERDLRVNKIDSSDPYNLESP